MKKIGEILVENGTLTQEQLQKALEQQKQEPGKLLGRILIQNGWVTEDDIVVALATQFNVPYLPLANFDFSKSTNGIIPKELIQKYMCVPLERVGNLLPLVMADPTNEQAISEIESVTKCRVQIFVATATEIVAVLQQHFHINFPSMPELKAGLSEVSFKSAVTQKSEQKTARKI